jgi:hypothetical protein
LQAFIRLLILQEGKQYIYIESTIRLYKKSVDPMEKIEEQRSEILSIFNEVEKASALRILVKTAVS